MAPFSFYLFLCAYKHLFLFNKKIIYKANTLNEPIYNDACCCDGNGFIEAVFIFIVKGTCCNQTRNITKNKLYIGVDV
jgi:hypothetical protein